MPEVVIFTDGGCDPNPGVGGWAAVLVYKRGDKCVKKELSGFNPSTTNNRMELTAVLKSLTALKKPCSVIVYTDSVYVKDGIGNWKNGSPTKKGWMIGWKENNWRRKKGKLLNTDLWKALYIEVQRHDKIEMKLVKGHTGVVLNELCDYLATLARINGTKQAENLQ